MNGSGLSSVQRLDPVQELGKFRCGVPELDDWLQRRAWKNEVLGGSRTYVVCFGNRVVGYYALAAGAIARQSAQGSLRRNMPDPIPVLILGRLAIDQEYQGQRIGTALLQDAVLRTVQAAGIAGVKALLVHAISENAAQFYRHWGFQESEVHPNTLLLSVEQARKLIL